MESVGVLLGQFTPETPCPLTCLLSKLKLTQLSQLLGHTITNTRFTSTLVVRLDIIVGHAASQLSSTRSSSRN